MRQDPPAAVAPVIPARAPGGVSARRSGVATLAKPKVRPGVQPGWPVRRLASCAHPAGVSAMIHASGWLPTSRCAGRSQDAAVAGQSTTARTWPAPAVQAAASASAAPAEAGMAPVADGDRLCPGGAEHLDEPVQFRSGMGLRRLAGSRVAGERRLGYPR